LVFHNDYGYHEDMPVHEGVPEEYLDIVMTCPVEAGKGEGAKALRDVLASDIGERITPMIVENIANAEELKAMGVDGEKATLMAFGGAIERDEHGDILREPEPSPEAAQPVQPQFAEAEKK
jgi:hypothetical protein